MIVHPDPEVAATLLGAHPDFRVLRRFQPRFLYHDIEPEGEYPVEVGLYVDVETTGLDTARDQIIELALLPFEFDDTGKVYAVGYGLNFFNDPGVPIPPEITALTGITDEMVKGQSIDELLVAELLREKTIVIAHNAEFDRKMLERRIPAFASKPWACSYREVEWARFGAVGSKLANILEGVCREFYDAHRALDDCRVGLHVLAAAQLEGVPALKDLLTSSAQSTLRVWAAGAPYVVKDQLKARGYRWCDGTTGRMKAWYRDIHESDLDAERVWLRRNAGIGLPPLERFTALDRYSVRAA